MQKHSTPPSENASMVIIGAGHCGGRAAQCLREAGWSGAIHLIGNEPFSPYERPPLSKDLLTGDKTAEQCALLSDADVASLGITRFFGQAIKVAPQFQCVTLSDGRVIPYQALLFATGGRVRRLNIPGGDLPQVLTLRGLDDAAALARRLTPGHRLAVIGGGFIGLEVAASAKKMGCDVTLIEGAARLMGRAVPEPVAERALALFRTHGVGVVLGIGPQSIRALDAGVVITLSDGTEVQADTVLVGIGIEPNTELASAAGLAVERGILVDKYLQSNAPGIYAAGDVAEFPSALSGQRIRQETWHNAETQAKIAALNMLGGRERYTSLPWFWSDQFDHQLQVVGEPALAATSVSRHLDADGLAIFYLDAESRLVGACGWGLASTVAKDLKIIRTLVERAVVVSPPALSDPATKLKALLKS